MDALEAFWRETDRRYDMSLVPRVRKAVITAAVNVGSYSIQLPGETGDRDQVPSVSPVAPIVGSIVRVELVGDEPIITAVLGRGNSQFSTTAFTLAGGTGTFPSGTVAAADTGSVTFTTPYTATPVIMLTAVIGSNLDVGTNVTVRSATGFSWRVFARDPGTSWNGGTGTLMWHSIGA